MVASEATDSVWGEFEDNITRFPGIENWANGPSVTHPPPVTVLSSEDGVG